MKIDRNQEPSVRTRVLILANPASGGFRPDTLRRLAAELRAKDVEVDTRFTRRAGEIAETCTDTALAADVLVVAGGDGSINEALTGLLSRSTPPPLAVVPFGTANVLANELKLPGKPGEIADMIVRGRRRNLYTGLANGKPFVLMASVGFDAAVVHNVSPRLKRRLGKCAYVAAALHTAFRAKSTRLEVDDGHTVHQCRLAIVTNGSRYGGPFILCPDADVTEPGLYLVTLRSDNPLSLAWFGFNLVTSRIYKLKSARISRADTIKISSPEPVPVQIDGDPFGSTPLSIKSSDRSVPVLVP